MPLQRNVTDHPLDVPAASVTVQPGDTVDFPLPVVGFEPAGEQDDNADPDGEQDHADEPSPPKTTRKRAAAKPASEEASE